MSLGLAGLGLVGAAGFEPRERAGGKAAAGSLASGEKGPFPD